MRERAGAGVPAQQATILGTRRRDRRALLRSTALQASFVIVLSTAARGQPAPNARPFGEQVVGGSASVSRTPGSTTIDQTSQRAALNWGGFDIGSRQTVTFDQPNSSAVVLNRVTGPDPSQIAGHLNANGQVIITNQSGVVFSRGAQVNTAGLVVSSAGLTTPNFMAGRMVFDQAGHPGAQVSNAGSITVRQSGLAALVAPRVANSGVITAKLGRVVLAGAAAHTVDLYGDGLVSIDVSGQVRTAPDGRGGTSTALVTNTGVINADGGTVLLTARAVDGIVQNLVSVGGTVAANTLGGRTGTVIASGVGGDLIIEGSVSATGGVGARGGAIQLATDGDVTLTGAARVSASGGVGGGAVALGTSLARAQSASPQARSLAGDAISRSVAVGRGALVSADATGQGAGGRVALLSRARTSHAGTITARGAGRGGGGFVEISSVAALSLTGRVDVSARGQLGAAGRILIDPTDIEIADSGTYAVTPISSAEFNNLTGNVSLVATHDLRIENTTLALGSASQSSISLSAGNDLFVGGQGIALPGFGTLASPQSLTLSAGHSLDVESSISSSGLVALLGSTTGSGATLIDSSVIAGDGTASMTITGGSGGITFAGGQGEGQANLSASVLTLTTPGAVVQTNAGEVGVSSLTGTVGSLALDDGQNQIGTLAAFSTAGGLSITGNSITVAGPVSAGGTVALSVLTMDDIGSITILGNITAPAVSLVAPGNISQNGGTIATASLSAIAGEDTSGLGSSSAFGSLSLPDANQISGLGTITTSGGVLIGNAASLTVTGPVSTAGTLSLLDGGTASAAGYDLAIDGVLSAPAIQLTASGNITEGAGGSLQELATSQFLIPATLTGSSGRSGAAGSATLNGPNSIATIGSFSSSGGFSFSNAGSLSIAGPLTVAGVASLTTVATQAVLAPGLQIAGDLTATGLVLNIKGGVSQTGGTVSAGSLSGTVDSAGGETGSLSLTTAAIGTLGALDAGFGLSLTDQVSLTIDGPVIAGNIALAAGTGPTGPADLIINGSIDAPNMTLQASRAILQTGGTVTATSLNLFAQSNSNGVTGSVLLGGSNAIGTLSGVLAAGNLTLADASPLTVGGTVQAANVSLRTDTISNAGSIVAEGTGIGTGDGTVTPNGLIELAPETPGLTVGYDLSALRGGTLRVGGTAASLDAPESNVSAVAGPLSVFGTFIPDASFTRVELLSRGGIAVNGTLALSGAGTIALASTGAAASAGITLAGDIGGSGQALTLATAGAVQQTGGVITASSLSGSVGSASLTLANSIATLGSFSAATLSLVDAGQLTVDGPVKVSGNAALTVLPPTQADAAGAPGGILFAGDLSAGSLVLTVPGAVTQSGGTLSATTLSGNVGGSGLVSGLGSLALSTTSIGSIGSLLATGSLSLDDRSPLTVTGPVGAGGTLALSAGDLGEPATLRLAGTVTAPTISLSANGSISQTAGSLSATSLSVLAGSTFDSGDVAGSAILLAGNAIGTLSRAQANGNFVFADTSTLTVAGQVAADSISLRTAGLINRGSLAATGTIELAPYAAGTPVSIGSAGGAAGYVLASGDGLSAATLRIGGTAADLAAPEANVTAANGSLSVLGDFSTGGTVTRLELVSGGTISVGGVVAVPGAGTITLINTATRGSGGIDVASGGALFSSFGSLSTPGSVTSEGTIAVSSLTGSIGAGTLYGTMRTTNLENLTSDGDLSIRDRAPLSITGSVHAGGALQIAQGFDGEDSGSGSISVPGITLAGDVSGASVTLASALRGVVQSSGVIDTPSLEVIAARQIDLPGANLVTAATLQATTGPVTLADAQSLQLGNALAGTGAVALSSAGNLSLSGTLTGGAVALQATGSVVEDGGLIRADSLAVSSLGSAAGEGVALGGANTLTTLLASSAVGSFALTDAAALTVSGNVSAGPSLTLATTGTNGALTLDAGLSATSVALDASGVISGAGSITAASLSGSAVSASLTSAANSIGTLGAFSVQTILDLATGSLSVTGPISAPDGAVLIRAVNTAAAGLTLAGSIDAASVTLQASTAVTQAPAGVVTAGQLTASAGTGDVALTGANAVGTLSGGSASGAFALDSVGTLAVLGTVRATDIALLSDGLALSPVGSLVASQLIELAPRTLSTPMLLGADAAGAGTYTLAGTDGFSAPTLRIGATADSLAAPFGAVTARTDALSVSGTGFSAANVDRLELYSGGGLTVSSLLGLTAPGSTLSLSALGSAGAIALDGTVLAPTLVLSADGAISETGRVVATVLDASAGPGGALLTGGTNLVGTLAGGATTGGFSLADDRSLLVDGVVSVGGALSLAASGGAATQPFDLTLGSDLSAGTVSLQADRNITQGAGIITTGLLLASAGRPAAGSLTTLTGSLTLLDANAVRALASVSATGDVRIADAVPLSVTGSADATGLLSLSSFGSLAGLTITGGLQAATVTLATSGAIDESAGRLAATSLSGSAGGAAVLTGSNSLGSLAAFSADRGFALADTGSLAVSGSVSAGTTLQLAAGGAASDLSLSGTLAAPVIRLGATGDITETGGAVDATTSLTGSAGGSWRLTGTANSIGTLGAASAGSTLTLADAGSLTVLGPVTAGTLELSAGTPTRAADLTLLGALSGSLTTLAASGSIVEAAGTLSATTLTGSAGQAALLTGSNRIGTLAAFSAGTTLTLADESNLLVLGAGAGQALTLDIGSAANPATLMLAGTISAPATTLDIRGGIDQSGGGILADTLSGSAGAAGARLTAANTITTLAGFTTPGALVLADAAPLAIDAPVHGSSVSLQTDSLAIGPGSAGAPLLSATTLVELAPYTLGGAITLDGAGGTDAAEAIAAPILRIGALSSNLADPTAPLTIRAGTLTIGAAGFTPDASVSRLELWSSGALAVNGALSLPDGTISLAAVSPAGTPAATLRLAGTVDPGIVLLAATGAITQTPAGAITAGTLASATDPTGMPITSGSATLTAANQIGTLGGFATGSLDLVDATGLVIAGPVQSPAISITATGSLTLAGALMTHDATLSVLADAAGGAAFQQVDGGAVQGAGSALTVDLPAGGSATLADFVAPQTALTFNLGSGIAGGQLDVATLMLDAAGGSAAFTGSTVGAVTGGTAAVSARITPAIDARYTLNGCVIGSTSCVIRIVRVMPVAPISPVTPALLATANAISDGGRTVAADFSAALANAAFAAVLASARDESEGIAFINPMQDLSNGPLRDPQRDPDLRLPNVGERDF